MFIQFVGTITEMIAILSMSFIGNTRKSIFLFEIKFSVQKKTVRKI